MKDLISLMIQFLERDREHLSAAMKRPDIKPEISGLCAGTVAAEKLVISRLRVLKHDDMVK